MKVLFELPEPLPDKYDKHGVHKTLSATTLKIYKAKLNKLAENGYKNVNDLLARPEYVVRTVDTLCPGDEDDSKVRQQKRVFYCAIFAVLPNYYTSRPNPYYSAFQDNLHDFS